MRLLFFIVGIVLLGGCAVYHPRPISPEKTASNFEARSFTNEDLRAFLATNHVDGPWPRQSWDLGTLTLVAFYYQPAFAEARATWTAAQAAEITAGERPNPSVSVTPAYDNQIPDNPTPWIIPVSFDIPIETAGKRGRRMAEAEQLAESARWDFISVAWQTRSKVRTALLNLQAARETESLLTGQMLAQSNVVRLLEGQRAAGSVSDYDVTQARVTFETTQLARQEAIGQLDQARAALAGALGIPLRALNGVKLSFGLMDRFPRELTRPEVRRQALFNRADVRAALADYAASQAALQLEIANQYPDIHLGPGYAYNNGNAGDNQWELGLTVTLPLLNHNQGAVAEAEAKRTQAAAHFLSVQAAAISEIDGALAGYNAALKESATAQSLRGDLRRQLDSVKAQAKLGEADALTLADAEAAYYTGAQDHLNSLIKAQQALGALEDAVQSPLTISPEILERAQKDLSKSQ
ncbi:MAG TPA: TolC family protein [Verrucomicrobiae bacterium]|jgi:outer membrane protein TolC|nr:TolC family protein [Verrucomicrobiae bacterium]